MAVRHGSDFWLYLDILPDTFKVSYLSRLSGALCSLHLRMKRIQLDNAPTIMIFLKHFDTTKQSLFGIGKIDMPRASKVSDLIPIVNERMKWASETPLKFHEVVNCTFSRTRRANL